MRYSAADVRAARDYLAGLTDDRAVQVHRWLEKLNGAPPEETPGQIEIPVPVETGGR